MKRLTGVVTRSQTKSALCHGDCTGDSLVSETVQGKKMSDSESSHDIEDALKRLEHLFFKQNEVLDSTLADVQAAIDKVPLHVPKAVRLEFFSGYESQDIDRWLQKFENRIRASGRDFDPRAKAADLASHLVNKALVNRLIRISNLLAALASVLAYQMKIGYIFLCKVCATISNVKCLCTNQLIIKRPKI